MLISLDQIQILASIEDAGSISAAAQKLRRAKSAIYYAMKKLEEQVGFQILETSAYRGTLTPKGVQLLRKSRPMLDQMKEVIESAHQIATGVESKLSISATALYSLKKFNRVMRKLLDEYPNTELISHREILSGEKLLVQEIVDIAILESITRRSEFEYKKIDDVSLALVIAPQHQFLGLPKSQQTESNLIGFPRIVQRSTIPDDDLHGVYKGSKRWTVTDLASKRQIILDGLGWGRLPYHEIDEDLTSGDLVILDHIEKPSKIPIYICRPRRDDYGTVSQAIWHSFSSDED